MKISKMQQVERYYAFKWVCCDCSARCRMLSLVPLSCAREEAFQCDSTMACLMCAPVADMILMGRKTQHNLFACLQRLDHKMP